MNRRNFFQSIAKTIATIAVAQQLVKSWVVDNLAASAPLRQDYKLNPEYEKATPIYFLINGESWKTIRVGPTPSNV